MMRTVGRQTYRSNAPAQSPKDYYRINLFIPVLDHFITSLTDRFSTHQWMAYRVSVLIPSMIENKSFVDLKDCISLYEDHLPSTSTIKEEFELYKRKWLNEASDNRPNNAIDAYVQCNGIFFPNIKILLQIYATLPVTTATGERSFSTLKLTKSYLRNTMSENRLNGLAMMYIHSMIEIDVEQVIDEFSRRKNRKLDFHI
jgi:hAT family C-terminal dimerisation region